MKLDISVSPLLVGSYPGFTLGIWTSACVSSVIDVMNGLESCRLLRLFLTKGKWKIDHRKKSILESVRLTYFFGSVNSVFEGEKSGACVFYI